MKNIRLFSFANLLHLLICTVLMLGLHDTLIARAKIEVIPKPGNVIRVWTVGSPHTGNLPPAVVPPELQQKAESLGYTIEIEAFRAQGFAEKFRQALQIHNEPEVLTFDNYGVVVGVNTSSGWVEGVASDPRMAPSLILVHEALAPLQLRGWVLLVGSATNYEAARTLSMQPPSCSAGSGPTARSPNLQLTLPQTKQTAALATGAYIACDQDSLSAISDGSRLGRKCFLPESDTKVESVKVCQVSGNRNLVFVSLVSTFSSQARLPLTEPGSGYRMELGQQSIFAVLRNEDGAWRLLAITHDPVNTVARMPLTNHSLANSLDDGPIAGPAPEPARPLTPDGVYPQPAQGERFGDFVWQPSQGTDLIGQVVEFMFGRDTKRGMTRLFFLTKSESRLSSGYLMSGGTSVWRVWSISKSGDIAFSEQHSYRH